MDTYVVVVLVLGHGRIQHTTYITDFVGWLLALHDVFTYSTWVPG